jgi:hypothetical protein
VGDDNKGASIARSARAESNVVPIRDKAVQVVVVTTDVSPGLEGIRANEKEPRSEDVTDGNASAPVSLGAHTTTSW